VIQTKSRREKMKDTVCAKCTFSWDWWTKGTNILYLLWCVYVH